MGSYSGFLVWFLNMASHYDLLWWLLIGASH